jgi:hypothetical protein
MFIFGIENSAQGERHQSCSLPEHAPFASKEWHMVKKRRKKLRATVEKIIKPIAPGVPEKVQIAVEEADHLYREIRVDNILTDESGNKASLKPHAKVEVIVEADADATTSSGNS